MVRAHNPFPNLGKPRKTSEETDFYNCIAWAFQDNSRWWWPNKHSYWPRKIDTNRSTLQLFEELFLEEGWKECENADPETGVEKIALYCDDGEPTHAARLLDNGWWTSKLGKNIDISHTLNELEGGDYGNVYKIFAK